MRPATLPTWQRSLGWMLLAALPVVACFAEPKGTFSGGGQPPATGGAGGRTGSSGGSDGNKANQGGTGASGGDTSPGFGGFPTAGDTGSSGAAGSDEPPPSNALCPDVLGEPLPARRAITSEDAPTPTTAQSLTLTRQSLFNSFMKLGCGACHAGSDNPHADEGEAFQVTFGSFSERETIGSDALERILSPDLDLVMPPGSRDGSTRTANDPTRQFGERLLAWQKAGFPDSFEYVLPSKDPGGGPTDPGKAYLLSPALGKKLTNLGSCLPSTAAMLSLSPDEQQEMKDKDALFAALETSDDLPDTLFETDLVSLDSATLSRRHVFSYAPTYPLYSDHAGKMRHLRVPLGKTIRYDEALRDLVIPDNTRFYKTFLKQVYDKDGNLGYRKMETRLIVVRQDEQLPDGSYKTHALRAAYAWNREETMAQRVTDPLLSTAPAADRLCPYIVDERAPRDPLLNPISDQLSEYCEYMTAKELDDVSSGKIRHYAIPSTQRCDQCHMGSSSHSYILGFTPWQVDRRKAGEGGVYEDPTDDEVEQLARLIDYGVVTGLEPGQAKLEESQLIADPPRTPRNDHELTAQGYMLGNCAFCHNPHGFPVVQNSILKPFELFPSETGGIFRFPLEKFSPRAKVGKSQSIRLPYITSAFGDVELTLDADVPNNQHRKAITMFSPVVDGDSGTASDYNPSTATFEFLGPWRSLLWRNVYTPFTYEEDGTIFIHMPRNAPGFDCRAPRIMANWMLSIPVVKKPNQDDQPVMEVLDDPSQKVKFVQARGIAEQRLAAYAASVTGAWCPNDDDIVDPAVTLSPIDPATNRHQTASPPDLGITGPRVKPEYAAPGALEDVVPDHAHWVPTDTSELPGKWIPRRPNWQDILVTGKVKLSDDVSHVIEILQDVHLSQELHDFALQPMPMGLWHAECQSRSELTDTPRVQDLLADGTGPLEGWLEREIIAGSRPPLASAHVHFQSRGESVFQAICRNCHGKDIDSKSPLAATISELTGGQTRVANFRDGLFGPTSAPGAFAHDEFLIDAGATPEDWQARYVLFMGLGGTAANIPRVVLDLVATSPFYGVAATAPGAATPNMLGSAQQFCFKVLAQSRALGQDTPAPQFSADGSVFVGGSAHYELWESLCSFGSDPIVHVFTPRGIPPVSNFSLLYRARDDSGAWIYPTDALVGNARGDVEHGIQPSNLSPWCIDGTTEAQRAIARNWASSLDTPLAEDSIPYCPPALFASALDLPIHRVALDNNFNEPDLTVPFGNQEFADRWLLRGAMNAGLAAFYFMRGFTSHEVTPAKPYDFCR